MFDLKSNRRSLFLGLLFALLFAPSTFAQTVTGTLQGTVSDSKGAVVPGADVVIRNVETGQERNLKTGGDGVYVAPFLPLGRYTVTASSAGFNKVAQENIEVTLNQTRVIDFTLQPEFGDRSCGGHIRRRADQYDERRDQRLAQRTGDSREADVQSGQLSDAGRNLHRISGEPDLGTEQSDRVVRLFDQLQRHRHARRDFPDQRRQ